MRLSRLISTTGPDLRITGPHDPEISAIVVDPGEVKPGSMFVAALLTKEFDGHHHLQEVIKRRATVIVARPPRPPGLSHEITWCRSDRPDVILGESLAVWHGHPSKKLDVLAVTGTNGKTTVCALLEAILRTAGHEPATIGTLGIHWSEKHRKLPPPYSTPTAQILQPLLSELLQEGVSHIAMEATNHALAIGRMAGTRVKTGGFTNLSRDHLDYHGDMKAYRDSKWKLFGDIAGRACFNIDDPVGQEFASEYRGTKLTVSLKSSTADLHLEQIESKTMSSSARLCTPWGTHQLNLPLFGSHNLENALVALGMAALNDIPLDRIIEGLSNADAPHGRCQWVGGRIMIDYAHTPEALARILDELRKQTTSRLICVFGAGGDRDKGKRAEMGAVAAERADLAIVTTDNPRNEEPESIVRDIMTGIPNNANYLIEPNRRRSIARAIKEARRDDIVLIAGKGHEVHLQIGDRQIPHNDPEIVRELLSSL